MTAMLTGLSLNMTDQMRVMCDAVCPAPQDMPDCRRELRGSLDSA